MDSEEKISLVIARTDQSIEWNFDIDDDFDVYFYNAGSPIENDSILERVDYIIDTEGVETPSEVYIQHILTQLQGNNSITVFMPFDAFDAGPQLSDWLKTCREWRLAGSDQVQSSTDASMIIAPEIKAFSFTDLLQDEHARGTNGTNIVSSYLASCGFPELSKSAAEATSGFYSPRQVFAIRNAAVNALPGNLWEKLHNAVRVRGVGDLLLSKLWLHLFDIPFGSEPMSPSTADTQTANPATAFSPVMKQADLMPEREVHQPATTDIASFVEIIMRQKALIEQQNEALAQYRGTLLDLPRQLQKTRRRRLFITTGYFATTVAATVVQQIGDDADNYLLIILDRQHVAGNKRWAYQMHDRWASVITTSHIEYYVNKTLFVNPFGFDFDEVFSPDITIRNFVREKFKAHRYHFFEEGLATYEHLNRLGNDEGVLTYLLLPEIANSTGGTTVAIDAEIFRKNIKKSFRYYDVPRFDNGNNIILMATGIPVDAAEKREMSFVFFEEVVHRLKSDGYQNIWLKPHPRVAVSDIFQLSRLATQGVRLLDTTAPLVEAVVEKNIDKIDMVISVYTSFSVYSEAIFGVKSRRVDAGVLGGYQHSLKAIQDTYVRHL